MLQLLLHTGEEVGVLDERPDATVVVSQLFLALLQPTVQLDNVGVLIDPRLVYSTSETFALSP